MARMRGFKSGGVYRLLCLISTTIVLACGQSQETTPSTSAPPQPTGATESPAPKWTPGYGDAPIGYAGAVPALVAQGADLRLSGWAVDGVDGAPVKSVTVSIDGKTSVPASLGFPRADVVDALGRPEMRRSGWIAVINTAQLSPGRHTFEVTAENSRGKKSKLPPVAEASFSIEKQ